MVIVKVKHFSSKPSKINGCKSSLISIVLLNVWVYNVVIDNQTLKVNTMKQAKVLNEAEIKRVKAILQTRRYAERDNAMFDMTLFAGLRACELQALLVKNVYQEDGTVRDSFQLSAHQTKGNKAQEVFVAPKLARTLKQYHNYLARNERSIQPNKPLFQSQKGGALDVQAIINLFIKLYRDSGINGASSHSGRRTAITVMADHSINARVIQAFARHSHLNTTQRYIDINASKVNKALASVFG